MPKQLFTSFLLRTADAPPQMVPALLHLRPPGGKTKSLKSWTAPHPGDRQTKRNGCVLQALVGATSIPTGSWVACMMKETVPAPRHLQQSAHAAGFTAG